MLIFAETLYYLVVSFAVIIIGALVAVVVYHLIYIAKNLRHISDNLDETSGDLKKRIEEIIERLSSLPILSYFLKKNGGQGSRISHKKGRNI
jgi:predicted PurR-regulated permease PerM